MDAPPRYHWPLGGVSPATAAPLEPLCTTPFSTRTPSSPPPRSSTDCAPPSTPRLDAQGHVYLDYTGGGLYAESQLRDHLALMGGQVFGNPHSKNLTSLAMTSWSSRRAVMCCGTSMRRPTNTWRSSRRTRPARSSWSASRTRSRPARLRADRRQPQLGERHPRVRARQGRDGRPTCRSWPGAARRSRTRSRARWRARPARRTSCSPIRRNRTSPACSTRSSGSPRRRRTGWDVLLDAAAFVPTNRLDLSRVHPDFVDISFYKIFGYPTGIGCLLARKARAAEAACAPGTPAARSRSRRSPRRATT